MNLNDTLSFSFKTVASYRTRSLLIVLAMALGVGAVVVLTALGEGARQYVIGQFTSIGTNLVVVFPGRAETAGGFPGAALGETPRDLTLEDARALGHLPQVRRYAPLNVGVAELAALARLREVTVLGSTADILPIRHMNLAQGSFLSREKGTERSAQIILGAKLAREFFPQGNAVGQRVRLGDRRFLVSGVLEPQGESMGFNSDEIVVIPIDYAQALFNTSSLFRILVETKSRGDLAAAKDAIREIMKQRHDGEEDVTVITQDAVLATFDRILRALTLGVAGIAAISLAVAGILVMNVMLVAV
ncbi:MAG TPA: ABC transporter permease, partial [Nitrosospira sp.]